MEALHLYKSAVTSQKTPLNRQEAMICNRLFWRVREALDGKTPSQIFHPSASEYIMTHKVVEDVRSDIRSHKQDSEISYSLNNQFIAYDIQYFYRNLYKYIMVSYYVQTRRYVRFCYNTLADIGTGAGTFAAAWMTVASLLGTASAEAIILSDQETLQRDLALRHLTRLQAMGIFGAHQPALVTRPGDFRQHATVRDALYLFGYVLPGKPIAANIFADGMRAGLFVDYNSNLDKLDSMTPAWKDKLRIVLHSKVPSNHLSLIKSPTVDAKFLFYQNV